ncbi:MAG: nitroreductase family protein, partial [Chloroflexi bacterium]|nr:nitroreductase family protein [Chloroflexota bacterium]
TGLVPENQFATAVQALQPDRDLTALLGAYGRLIAPPYVVVPVIAGSHNLLIDLGYRAEQIIIALAQLGLGTCFVGTLMHDEEARRVFQILPGQQHAAVVAFGHPAETFSGVIHNRLVRTLAGANNKLPADQLYYEDLDESPLPPPPNWAPLIEAARAAPSAINTQPWRFLGRGNHLYLFAVRHSSKYGRGPGAGYKFFDSGICLANIDLAMQALGLRGASRLCLEPDDSVPAYPQRFQPVAEIVLGES